LEGLNRSAASSLIEGLEKTLTLHRLGLFDELGTSLKTANCHPKTLTANSANTSGASSAGRTQISVSAGWRWG